MVLDRRPTLVVLILGKFLFVVAVVAIVCIARFRAADQCTILQACFPVSMTTLTWMTQLTSDYDEKHSFIAFEKLAVTRASGDFA